MQRMQPAAQMSHAGCILNTCKGVFILYLAKNKPSSVQIADFIMYREFACNKREKTKILKPKYRGHIHKNFGEFVLEPQQKNQRSGPTALSTMCCARNAGTLICNSTRWLKGEFPSKVARDRPQGSRVAFSPPSTSLRSCQLKERTYMHSQVVCEVYMQPTRSACGRRRILTRARRGGLFFLSLSLYAAGSFR